MNRLRRYLHFRKASVNRHGVHSPFVFELLERGLRTRRHVPLLQRLQQYLGDDVQVCDAASCRQIMNDGHSDKTVIYVPGIHDSGFMLQEWKALASHPAVTLSLEFWEGGLLFFRKEFLVKQHFLLRYKK